jgi:hypothetical protein
VGVARAPTPGEEPAWAVALAVWAECPAARVRAVARRLGADKYAGPPGGPRRAPGGRAWQGGVGPGGRGNNQHGSVGTPGAPARGGRLGQRPGQDQPGIIVEGNMEKMLALLFGVVLALGPLPARAQAPVTIDIVDCGWAQPDLEGFDRARVYSCVGTDGSLAVYLPGSTRRVLAFVWLPDYGTFFTPLGRLRLPQTWRRFSEEGRAHALQPAALDRSACPGFDANWARHIVYTATVTVDGSGRTVTGPTRLRLLLDDTVTVTVWVAPNGDFCVLPW